MEKRTYYLAVYRAPEGGFTCSFPDFECVVDQGETLEETIGNARQLLDCEIGYLNEKKLPFPSASTPDELYQRLDSSPWTLVPVEVFLPEECQERINITIYRHDLREISAYAKRNGLSRSKLMTEATLAYIRGASPQEMAVKS